MDKQMHRIAAAKRGIVGLGMLNPGVYLVRLTTGESAVTSTARAAGW